MAPTRKRTRRDVQSEANASAAASASDPASARAVEPSLLQRLRSTWQFANLYQWIFLFGQVVKIDESVDIDVLETECLKPHSTILVDIGLALLKFISPQRGLTRDMFDEYTRRQYVTKDPDHNPFGTDENPAKFDDFDVFTKLRVLQKLTQWIMRDPERLRENLNTQKPSDQTEWRIEPYGWDSKDRSYFLLDDDRLYRMTDAPPPRSRSTWKAKQNSKKAKAAARASKRRKVSKSAAADAHDDTNDNGHDAMEIDVEEAPTTATQADDEGLGGAKWECLAVSLAELQAFIATLRKTRDDNERILRDRLEDHVVPILAKYEESRKRKELQRQKELATLEKLAHAKRSSRLAGKADLQRQEEQRREEEQRRRIEEAAAKKEERERIKREKERDNRMMSREARVKEREARRRRHEEELARLAEDSENGTTGSEGAAARMSARQRLVEIDKNKRALEELRAEDADWIFDCVCGVYGQVDDGTHSIACESCNVWQHSKCEGISKEEADRDDFHFVCKTCRRKEAARAAAPKTIIKLKVKDSKAHDTPAGLNFVVEIPSKPVPKPGSSNASSSHSKVAPAALNGPHLAQSGQTSSPQQATIPVKASGRIALPPPASPHGKGEGSNPFSSPHPALSPPEQSPIKFRAYGTITHSSPISASNANGEHNSLPPKGEFHRSPKVNGATRPEVSVTSGMAAKQPAQVESVNGILPAYPPPSPSFADTTRRLSGGIGATSPVLSTPNLNHGQAGSSAGGASPTLPPPMNGMSPQKRSPPTPQPWSNGVASASVVPPVLPLSPSQSQQTSRAPVKRREPVRPASSSGPFGGF